VGSLSCGAGGQHTQFTALFQEQVHDRKIPPRFSSTRALLLLVPKSPLHHHWYELFQGGDQILTNGRLSSTIICFQSPLAQVQWGVCSVIQGFRNGRQRAKRKNNGLQLYHRIAIIRAICQDAATACSFPLLSHQPATVVALFIRSTAAG
jgi:hypothetical protein